MAFLNFIFKEKQQQDGEPSDDPESISAVEAEETEAAESPVEGEAPVLQTDEAGPAEETASELGSAEDMDLEQLVEALQLISEFLDEDAEEEAATSEDATPIPFTLEQLSDLMTDTFDAEALARADTTKMVNILVSDVYAQLGQGRVTAPVRAVLAEVPPELLAKGFDRFSKEEVDIPLQVVVAAVHPEDLQSRTADEDGSSSLEGMPDLFAAGAATAAAEGVSGPEETGGLPSLDDMADPFAVGSPKPSAEEEVAGGNEAGEEGGLKLDLDGNADIFSFSASTVSDEAAEETSVDASDAPEAAPAEATPPAEEAPVDEEASVEEQDAAPEVEPIVVAEDVFAPAEALVEAQPEETETLEEESTGPVLLSGLDLNQADAEAMSRKLDGVGPRLAERIVRHRQVNGPFRSVADLARVQGVGPSTYRKMTGKSWSEARDSLKRTLDYVLGADSQSVPDLKAVARRVQSLTGFEGCVFAHTDGDMLAAAWDDNSLDVLGAVAPQMIKKLQPYVDELNLGDLNLLTLHLGDTAICLLQSGHVIMATVHRATGLSRRQVRLIELVGTELEQRFDVSVQA